MIFSTAFCLWQFTEAIRIRYLLVEFMFFLQQTLLESQTIMQYNDFHIPVKHI